LNCFMESDDEQDKHTHTWSNIGWQAALLVRKLRNQPPERRAEPKPRAQVTREGAVDSTKEPNAQGMKPREVVKL
jgi:hypothetical protein